MAESPSGGLTAPVINTSILFAFAFPWALMKKMWGEPLNPAVANAAVLFCDSLFPLVSGLGQV